MGLSPPFSSPRLSEIFMELCWDPLFLSHEELAG
jgi:hypothetical protein